MTYIHTYIPAQEPPPGVALEPQHRLADPLHRLVPASAAAAAARDVAREVRALPVLEQEGHAGGFEARGRSRRSRRGGG